MKGMILDAQEMVLEALIERFGLVKPGLSVKIRGRIVYSINLKIFSISKLFFNTSASWFNPCSTL